MQLIEDNELKIKEMEYVLSSCNFPMLAFGNNVRYLLAKYKVSRKDLKTVYKHLSVSPFTLNKIVNNKLPSVSVLYVCILVNFFNKKYNAGLSFVDMFVDLEQRELLDSF